MAERESWEQLRDRRLAEPGAAEAYEAARLAFELGVAVRELRQARDWSQGGVGGSGRHDAVCGGAFRGWRHGADIDGAGPYCSGLGRRSDRPCGVADRGGVIEADLFSEPQLRS